MKDIRKKISDRVKLNNEGSTVITVLVIMAMCIILLTIILSASLLNFQMKIHSRQSNANFYDAEAALEMIRMGLVADASDAAADSYLSTMEKYDLLAADERKEYFDSSYANQIIKKIASPSSRSYYDIDYIDSLLGDTAMSFNVNFGAEITTAANTNFLNATDEGVVLKNVRVRYTDSDQYVNEIQTDIVLAYPNISFELGGKTPNLANYALVANECVEVLTDTSVSGNAYLGKNDVYEDKTSMVSAGVSLNFDSSVNNKKVGNGAGAKVEPSVNCDVIADGFFALNGSASFDHINLWLNDLQVDSASLNIVDGVTVMDDDLVMAATKAVEQQDKSKRVGSSAVISGEYYGVGQGKVAEESSAIVINGLNTTLDLSGLEKMMIGGVSYVDTSNHTLDEEKTDILMGESIAIKPNQRAYLVPPEMIAPGTNNGGMNPMMTTRYTKLVDELKSLHGDDYRNYMVDYSNGNPELFSHVVGYKEVSYPVINSNKTITMTYLFMVFDDEENASRYYNQYMTDETHKQRLTNNIKLYTKSENGFRLPDDIMTADNLDFYYNGTILKSDDSNLLLPRKELTSAAKKTLTDYENQYKALNCKLVKDYSALSESERNQDVYHNLVKPMASGFSDNKYVITAGKSKSFVSTSGGGAAMVVNGGGTFVLSNDLINSASSFEDAQGNTHANAKLNVLIVDGDVKVTATQFDGMIVASGKITFQNGGGDTVIKANPVAVLKALSAEDKNGVMAVDYLKDSESYLLGGVTSGVDDGSTESIGVSNLVYYANWSKR